MSTRTLTLTNTLAYAGVQVYSYLQTPGGFPVTDLDGKVYFNGQAWGQSLITGAVGDPWSLTDVYPGDLRDGAGNPLATPVQIVVIEGSQKTLSPPGFSYASSITVSTWYPVAAGSTTGMFPMFLDLALLDTTPDVGADLVFTLSTTVLAPNGQTLRGGVPIDGTTNTNGIVSNLFWPSSGLDPNTAAYLVLFPDSSVWKFRRPDNPTGYAGAYAGGTTYHAATGPLASQVGSVVLWTDGNLYTYSNATPGSGHDPTNASYWTLWIGEPIGWNLTNISSAGVPTIDTTGVRNSPNLTPESGDPIGSPATLDDNMVNLAARVDGVANPAVQAAARIYAFKNLR